MKFFKWFVSLWVTLALVACGGGGGSAGTVAVGSGSTTGSGSTAAASMTLQLIKLVNNQEELVSPPQLSQTDSLYLKVALKDAKGAAVAYARVTVSLDNDMARLTPLSGSVLTGSDGAASVAIAPASVTASGAITATAKVSVAGVEVSKTLDLQINASNVKLSRLEVSPDLVQLGQSVGVGVYVTLNGDPAPSNSVMVTFASNCGTVAPASAQVDNYGMASAVIQTTVVGTCSVSASAAGVTSLSKDYTVSAAPVTGIQFVTASPEVIYQSDSVGANSSLVKFQVIDSNGKPVSGQTVSAVLVNSTGGASFCDGTPTGSKAVSAAGSGEVAFSVCAGQHPETLQVRASLDLNGDGKPDFYTDSNFLRVQTGLPTQRFFDIAADRLNMYCGGLFASKVNNNFASITVNLADRQGNPVPNRTPVVFVTEGGQINSSNISSCLIDNGGCTVRLLCQDYRPLGSMNVDGTPLGDPRPGRVTVLAMADGEESFIDKNNNNRYDAYPQDPALDELFEDLGVPFMDKNEDGILTLTYKNRVINTDEGEVSYPIAGAAIGRSDCPGNSNVGLSQPLTCNKEWNGSGTKPDGSRYTPTKVRRSIVIVFSGGEIGQPGFYDSSILAEYRTAVLKNINIDTNKDDKDKSYEDNSGQMRVRLADYDGNPLPADAGLSVIVRKPDSSKCMATFLDSVIGNSTEPTTHDVVLDKCAGGEVVDFKVEVSFGSATRTSVFSVTVPVATVPVP